MIFTLSVLTFCVKLLCVICFYVVFNHSRIIYRKMLRKEPVANDLVKLCRLGAGMIFVISALALIRYIEKYGGAEDAHETSIDNSELESAIDIYKTQSPSTADSTSIDKVNFVFKEFIAKEVPE